jgi:hypothetical protein
MIQQKKNKRELIFKKELIFEIYQKLPGKKKKNKQITPKMYKEKLQTNKNTNLLTS